MSKSNAFENAVLLLLFNGTAIADLAENDTTSPAANLHLSLHEAWPGEASSQSTNEADYSTYAREAVARDNSGFVVTGNAVALAANADFPAAGSGDSGTIFYFGVGTASSGAGLLMYWGVLGSALGPFTAKADDTLTLPGLAGLAVSDRIAFFAGEGALPAGLTEGTVYFVLTVSGDDITVSATDGGAALNITAAGDGVAYRVTPVNIAEGVIPRISSGSAFLTED